MTIQVRRRTRTEGILSPPTAIDAEAMVDGFATGIEEYLPVSTIEELVEHYTGSRVSIDHSYYPPPPPPSGHVLLDNAAPGTVAGIALPTYSTRNRIETEEAYRRTYLMDTLHRLMMRNANMRQAADAMNLPLQEVYAIRADLFRHLSKAAANMDLSLLAGKTLRFYDEMRGMALRELDALQGPAANAVNKTRFMAVAMAAENRKHVFLKDAGFFDTIKLTPAINTGNDTDEMAVLRQAMQAILDPTLDDYMEGDEEDEVGPQTGNHAGGVESLISVL